MRLRLFAVALFVTALGAALACGRDDPQASCAAPCKSSEDCPAVECTCGSTSGAKATIRLCAFDCCETDPARVCGCKDAGM